MKRCTGECGKDLPNTTEFFYKRTKKDAALRGFCRLCTAANTRANYQRNLEKRRAYIINRVKERKEYVRGKKSVGCCRCPEKDIACLDFHHIDPATKKYTIAHMITSGKSIKTIEAEIEKCIVLCRNCHAKHHHNEDPGNHKGL